ncbi:hypothetical protein AWH62_14465 [Maricaulis sp. W15]|uniref:hypothetical protein n=1 Tax=Maricaulis sp. W15 TaxID=1772333 RepID=UPI000948D163|nr:hypothetical protein [Maricaulis sp. W15]OLF80702.1 hypothetical protein AWH62_14465 [Maricaulis sp. W15]
MANPEDTLDPEPVDAEFEPADDSRAAGATAPKRGGALGHVLVFLLATVAGGAVGFAASRYVPAADMPDAGAAAERAALTSEITGLDTRLGALEAEDPAAAIALDIRSLEQRLATLEANGGSGSGGQTVDLSAIETRLDRLEVSANDASSGTAAQFDPSELEARLAALETALSLTDARAQQALDASQSAGDGAALDPQVVQALTDRIMAVEASVDALAAPARSDPAIAGLRQDLVALQSELDTIRGLAETARDRADSAARTASSQPVDTGQASRQLAARALALTALREIARTGDGFEAERAALARLWRGQADLAAMADYSRAGVPTLSELTASFPGDAIREAAGPGRVFFGLIEVRRTDGTDSDSGPLAMTALAERRLAENDLVGAVTIAERLDGEALETARDWLIQARARLDLDRRLQALRDALAAEAAEQGSDPT